MLWLYRVLEWMGGLWIFVLLGSSLLVLCTRRPCDPWRTQPTPANGEYIEASDGAQIFLRRWLPGDEVRQVVLGVHGLGTHSGYQRRAGEALAAVGIAYYALDVRGNGLTRTAHGDVPSLARIHADLDELLRALQQRHRGVSIYVLGHSLGAAMAITWAALRQPAIQGLLALAPAMTATTAPVPWLNSLKGPSTWLFFRHLAVLQVHASAYARERLSRKINLPEEVDFTVQDPLRLQAMSMAFGLAAWRALKQATLLAPRVGLPTLVLVGEDDEAQVGARQFYATLAAPDKAFVLMPHTQHNLFQLRETPAVMEAVIDWLQGH